MLPSQKWFPTNRTDRAAWFRNFAANFSVFGPSLGFTPAEIQAVMDDNQAVQFLAATITSLESYRRAVIEYRNNLCEGRAGTPKPTFPMDPNFVLPVDRPTGIYQRLDALVARIRVAPTYSPNIGAQLGIVPRKAETLALHESRPEITVTSMPKSVLVVKFVRGQSQGVTVEIQTGKENTWKQAGRFYTSPANLEIPPAEDKSPEEIRLRARYVMENTPVGLFSDVVTAVTTP
ncbi:MAG: hypothetical protein ABI878_10905 [Acidobacteriota bacterium]